ncbi:MAG TPA: hypothetical protein VHQ21_14710, partial [Rhodanobacteraceae bacterium]|nr:hypothetical protein [Rhodanobacteraceae bacterium]
MTETAPHATDIDPELSLRVQALSGECAALGRAWDGSQVQFLYDESEQLAERAQQAGIVDLSEALLGLSAYLSSFVETALQPSQDQLNQLHTLAESASDALARYRAHISVAVLGPDTRSLSAVQPMIHYFGQNPAHLEIL